MVTRGLSIKVTELDASSPVMLEEVKRFLELDDDYSDYDDLLDSLILKARRNCEKFTGCSIVSKSITARWESATTVELPYGPVTEITSVKNGDDETIDISEYKREGLIGDFVGLELNRELATEVTYKAGYEVVPEEFRVAIFKQVCDDFEQRTGFDLSGKLSVQKFPNDWKSTIRQYRRITWLD